MIDRRQTLLGAAALLLTSGRPGAAAEAGRRDAPAVQEFPFWQGRLLAIRDGAIPFDVGHVQGLPRDEAAGLLRLAQEPEGPALDVNAFVYRDGTRTVLIDAGGGGLVGRTGRLSEALEAADIGPAHVDTVLLTHLHADQIGGLMRDGEAAFPFAEIRVHADEVGRWNNTLLMRDAPAHEQPTFEAVRDLFGAYGGRIRDFGGAEEVTPGIRAVPMPGHTPGHTAFRIGGEDEADAALVWGDAVMAAPLQFRHPSAGVREDVDPEQAAESRSEAIERAARAGVLVAGTHLPFPGVGRVEAADGGYLWRPAG